MQNPLWNNDLIQFARLLAEISATQDHLDLPALAESMDLELAEVNVIFDRADAVWEAAKLDPAATMPPAMPDAVKVALDHVRANYPNVTQVFFGTDGRWLFCGDAFNYPDFDVKDIDVGLLESAVDSLDFLPAAFAVALTDQDDPHAELAEAVRGFLAKVESGWAIHASHIDPLRNATDPEALRIEVAKFLAKVDSGWAIHESNLKPMRDALAKTGHGALLGCQQ